MPSLERTVMVSIGFLLIWLILTSVNFHLTISSTEDQLMHLYLPPGLTRNISAATASFNYNKHQLSPKFKNIVRQIFSNEEQKAKEYADEMKYKTPFPQTIENEEFEEILHPAVVMRPVVDNDGSAAEKEEEEKEENGESANAGGQEDKDEGGEKEGESKSDEKIMAVPKFWNPPVFNNVRTYLGNYGERLITPEQASRIGSKIPSAKNYDVEVGDAEEVFEKGGVDGKEDIIRVSVDELPPANAEMLETIFVAIASYRDYRCPHTVEALFEQAAHPERIRVGVVDQLDPEEDDSCVKNKRSCEDHPQDTLCKYSHLIDVFEMDASLAVGPVFARHIGNRMYRGEYFFMQSDAHMEFVKGWDDEVIEQWRSAENEMAVLTTYVSEVVGHYNFDTGKRDSVNRPIMCVTEFDTDYYNANLSFLMHGQQPEDEPDVHGEPTLHPLWAAGFSFARGHFVVQVPYDQYLPMIFQGEEISIGLRAFTYGYDFYAPEKSVLFHYYSTHGKKKRKVKKFWEHSDKYEGIESESKARLLGIIQMLGVDPRPVEEGAEAEADGKSNGGLLRGKNKEKEEEEEGGKDGAENGEETEEVEISWNPIEERNYGLGKIRTVQKFMDTFGINLKDHTVEEHFCRFVGVDMNKVFLKHLRKDAMGIDYDQIKYKFKDPKKHGETWKEFM